MLLIIRKGNTFIEGDNRKSSIDASKFDLVAGAKEMERPEVLRGAAIDIYGLMLGIYQNVFYDTRATPVVNELLSPVVCFGTGRENFNDEARKVDRIACSPVALITTDSRVRIDVTCC